MGVRKLECIMLDLSPPSLRLLILMRILMPRRLCSLFSFSPSLACCASHTTPSRNANDVNKSIITTMSPSHLPLQFVASSPYLPTGSPIQGAGNALRSYHIGTFTMVVGYGPDSKAPSMVALQTCLLIVSSFAIGVRIYSRCRITKHFGHDDSGLPLSPMHG